MPSGATPLSLMGSLRLSISVRGNFEEVSGSKNRFQSVRPCKNLEEVRSLLHEQSLISASKRNFVIDRLWADVEVRLRRTFHLLWRSPSCAHLRWACMVFSIKVESSTRPASTRQKASLRYSTNAYSTHLEKHPRSYQTSERGCQVVQVVSVVVWKKQDADAIVFIVFLVFKKT